MKEYTAKCSVGFTFHKICSMCQKSFVFSKVVVWAVRVRRVGIEFKMKESKNVEEASACIRV